jgi:LAO/AO transport system kinase
LERNQIVEGVCQGNIRALARMITGIENEIPEFDSMMEEMHFANTPVIGFTGPPGAGKSTLISAFVKFLSSKGMKIAVLAVDPSSPFNQGSLLGDRLRMSEHYLMPNVFIRSMASRGSLGGLAPRVFEVCDILRAAQFDYILIETVGVGQSEVEIAALADTSVLVLVPEAGDDIQTIKSGIMEIADVFVLNKADRAGADIFLMNLQSLAHSHASATWETPVVKTVASKYEGIEELFNAIELHGKNPILSIKKNRLLAQKALNLIRHLRTRDIQFEALQKDIIESLSNEQNFNLYRYVKKYINL